MERTSSVAFWMSWPSWNWIRVLDEPWVTVEAIESTLERPARAFSTGRAIWLSISAGAAPLRVTLTITAGKLMLGKFLIGRPT